MTDAEKQHLYGVADLFLYFAKTAKREGILALEVSVDEDSMRLCEPYGDEETEFPVLSNDEHFAFAVLLQSIVDGTDSGIVAQIAQSLQKNSGNSLAIQLGIEAIKDIQAGVSEDAMTLKMYAMMGRELALEYMWHRKSLADAAEAEIAGYFLRAGTAGPSDEVAGSETGTLAFEDIADFKDESVLRILRELELGEVAKALKTGSEKIFIKIRDCLPPKVARALADEMMFMGPVRLSDVEAAQAHFVSIAERLGLR